MLEKILLFHLYVNYYLNKKKTAQVSGNKIGENITSDELEAKIKEKYPFKVDIVKDDEELVQSIGPGRFSVTIEWPFESGNDELDTLWGSKAYEYYSLNPGAKSVEIEITLIAEQIAE